MAHPVPSPEPPAAAPPPAPASPAKFSEPLASAFPSADATDDDLAILVDVSPDPRLLAVTPPRTPVRLADLIEAVANLRIIYLRGPAAIPITALIAIGGALLFHLLIVAVCLLGFYLALHSGYGGSDASLAQEPGGSGEGYMIASDNPPLAATDIKNLLAHAPTAPLPAPALPPDPQPLTSGQLAAAQLAPTLDDPAMIGIPSGDQRTGRIKPPPAPLPVRPATPPPDPTLVVAPPLPEAQTTLLASAGPRGPAASPRPGRGHGDSDSDDPYANEAVIPLTKSDAAGTGRGRGSGSGLDRGGSGANKPEPTLLEWPPMDLPNRFTMTLPTHDVICRVTVLADGSVGKVEVIESCGQTAIDELWRSRLLHDAKFRPAYRAGKPYTADGDFRWVFAR